MIITRRCFFLWFFSKRLNYNQSNWLLRLKKSLSFEMRSFYSYHSFKAKINLKDQMNFHSEAAVCEELQKKNRTEE